ncbi:heat shock protein 30C [Biomphalaria glabrata]|nr:heat shock protein 30C-like [Biomphalaria glabrata]KAI8779169.1 heat shock protein 30C [Biomphalaria glabrata]
MEPSRMDFSDPFFREPTLSSFRDPAVYTTRDPYIHQSLVRDPIRDVSTYQQPISTLPLARSFFNPERQLSTMDTELQRMATEMRRMFSDMQHLMPADSNPDNWRIKENFYLDNPVRQDQNSGQRFFRLQFDVRQFKPEEIFVKTIGNQLTVHAIHDDNQEGKSVHREYNRQYVLPKDLNPELLVSKLNREGVLTIEAPLPITDTYRDKLIPIKHE